MKNSKNYFLEFITVLFAVISAFGLNNWNETRKNRISEEKILREIRVGLARDLEDIEENIERHKNSILAAELYSNALKNIPIPRDSISFAHFRVITDIIIMQNISGYEVLKSKGLEIIENDALRTQLISLYEYDYNFMYRVEEKFHETQFHMQYSETFRNLLAPSYVFDEHGEITNVSIPLVLTHKDKQLLMLILRELKHQRKWSIHVCKRTAESIESLMKSIDAYLGQ